MSLISANTTGQWEEEVREKDEKEQDPLGKGRRERRGPRKGRRREGRERTGPSGKKKTNKKDEKEEEEKQKDEKEEDPVGRRREGEG